MEGKPILAELRRRQQADYVQLEDMQAEFDSIDVFDAELDHDLGNLILQACRSLDLLASDWLYLLRVHPDAIWEEISQLHTLLRAVPLFIGDCEDMTGSDFRVLELATRCNPIVKALWPEYAAWRSV